MNIDREPLADPAFPGFLDVTGTKLANTDAEVAQWTPKDGGAPFEVAAFHLWKGLTGCRVEEYRRGTPRHFYTLKFGGQPGAPGEAIVYLSPAQFAHLKEALTRKIPSHYAAE